MKHSEKREKILEIFRSGDLLTANEVCEKVPEVDRATIYRNLKLFVEQGILREVNINKGISSYEIKVQNDNHQHFICENCEKVIPIDIDPKVIEKVIPEGIEVEDFELNLKGRCGECK